MNSPPNLTAYEKTEDGSVEYGMDENAVVLLVELGE